MTSVSTSGNGRWRLAVILACASALNYADRAALSAVLPVLRADFALTDVQLGLLGSVFLWAYALGSPLAGSLADRCSRARLVQWSIMGWSLVTAAMGLVNGFGSLLALRFCLGATECLFLPAAIALLSEHHTAGTRARAMSFISIGVNSGLVLGGTLAGFVAERWGWRAGFLMLGLGGVGFAALVNGLLPSQEDVRALPAKTSTRRAGFFEAIAFLARVPSYYALLFESMLSGMALWVFFNWLPLYFRETYQFSLAEAGFAGTFMLQVSVVLGVIVGGWFSDRVSAQAPERRMLLYGLFYLASAPFLLLFLGQPSFVVVAAGISAFSFLRGLGQANDNPTQCEIVPSRYRSTGVGFMNAISTGTGGCAVLMTGLLKGHIGLGTVFAGVSLMFVLAGVILLTFQRCFLRTDIARAKAMESRN